MSCSASLSNRACTRVRDVNPNTGDPPDRSRRFAIAGNAIYHDAEHPSHIILPVVGRGDS